MIKLTKEARVWYRSAMVWLLGIAGLMYSVEKALPSIADSLPPGWYDNIMAVCVFVGAVAKFVRQPGMQKALERKVYGDE